MPKSPRPQVSALPARAAHKRSTAGAAGAEQAEDARLAQALAQVAALEEQLAAAAGRLHAMLSLSGDWFWEQDEHSRLTYLSDGAELAGGLDVAQLIGRRRDEYPGFEAAPAALDRQRELFEARKPFRDFTYGLHRRDGTTAWLRISGEPRFDPAGRFVGYRGICTDVSEVTMEARALEAAAKMDHLTGLLNRASFEERLEAARLRCDSNGGGFAVLFIDLDRFKEINDLHGHLVGDAVLKTVASRLQESARATDLVSRVGGDEFVVYADRITTTEEAHRLRARIAEGIAKPITHGALELRVGASIGVALFPTDGRSMEALIKASDADMYARKRAQRD